jgi:hypothetical protein
MVQVQEELGERQQQRRRQVQEVEVVVVPAQVEQQGQQVDYRDNIEHNHLYTVIPYVDIDIDNDIPYMSIYLCST